MTYPIAVMAPPDLPVNDFIGYVTTAERLGFAAVWFAEDCFWKGGVAQAAVALASTSSVVVGFGILPAAARNVVFAALDIGLLASLYPGRVVVGVGHGMSGWIAQVGASSASPLTLLAEWVDALRALLAGEEVNCSGRYVTLDRVQLYDPPTVVPKVLAGVRGPRSLAVAGQHADGTILAEPVTPEYLTAARAQISADGPHVLVAYNVASVHDDVTTARAQVRPALAVMGDPAWAPHISSLDFAPDFFELRARCVSADDFAQQLPNEWVDRLAVVGTPVQARARLDELHGAGADHLVLAPVGGNRLAALQELARVL